MPGQGEPGQRAFEITWIRSPPSRRGNVGGHEAREGRLRSCAHFRRPAERFEEREERTRGQARYELERRPSLDAGVDVHRGVTC